MPIRRNCLAQRRRFQGLSQEALAAKVGVDPKTVRRWESGETQSGPQPLHRLALARCLDVDLPQLDVLLISTAASETSGGSAQTIPVTGISTASGHQAQRRSISSGEGSEPWELLDVLESLSLSLEVVRHMRAAALEYAARYPDASPAELLPLIHGQLRRLHRALQLPQTIATRREAVTLLGVVAGLAGNLSLDAGRKDQARSYFDVGRVASREAGDLDLTAWLLANQSIERFCGADYQGALEFLNHAYELAASASTAGRRAWITALRAKTYAAMHQQFQSLRDLDQSYLAIGNADDPQGTDFFDSPRLDGIAGSTNLLLGRTAEGERLIAQAISQRSETNLKGKVLLMLDLADSRVTDGALEEAGRLVTKATEIAGQNPISPIIDRTHWVRDRLRGQQSEMGQQLCDSAAVETGRRS
jgi:transcriptional regulator with XRE-family HTH domain